MKKLKSIELKYVKQALDALPATLDETYERMLAGIDESLRDEERLGNQLERQFEQTEGTENLDEAIQEVRRAVNLTPEDSEDLASRLNNLGNKLASRFERLGRLDDLEEATDVTWRAFAWYAEALGPKHTLTLDAADNLLLFYKHQGKTQEAETLLRRGLTERKERLAQRLATLHDRLDVYPGLVQRDKAGSVYNQDRVGNEDLLQTIQDSLTHRDALTSTDSKWEPSFDRTISTKPTSLSDSEFGQAVDKASPSFASAKPTENNYTSSANTASAAAAAAAVAAADDDDDDEDEDRWSIRTTSTLVNLDPDLQLQGETQFALALFGRVAADLDDNPNVRYDVNGAVSGALVMYSHAMQQQANSLAEKMATKFVRQQSK